jgi:hypothetical protein
MTVASFCRSGFNPFVSFHQKIQHPKSPQLDMCGGNRGIAWGRYRGLDY